MMRIQQPRRYEMEQAEMIPRNLESLVPDHVRERLGLPRVGQVGYVVSDAHGSIDRHKDAYGLKPWLVIDTHSHDCVLRGSEVQSVLRIGLAYSGPVQVELIQVLEGESIHREHPNELEGEPHHLGFMVRDIDKRLSDCRRLGIGILQRGTIRETGITVDYAYLDTLDTAGIILELIQWRVGPVPMPTNRLVFNLVCAIGAKTVFRGRVIR
jgi:hypothetical protein